MQASRPFIGALLLRRESWPEECFDLGCFYMQRNGPIGQLPNELGKLSRLQIVRMGFSMLVLLLACVC